MQPGRSTAAHCYIAVLRKENVPENCGERGEGGGGEIAGCSVAVHGAVYGNSVNLKCRDGECCVIEILTEGAGFCLEGKEMGSGSCNAQPFG